MPDDYLLDTNVISVLANPANPGYAHVKVQFDAIPSGSRVAIPVIAIAEIEYGMAKTVAADPVQRATVRQFFIDHPLHYGIGNHTVEPYAVVRAKLWELHGTLKGGKKRSHHEKLPDELCVRGTAKWIGIDERDLLIVAIALEYNLTFVTKDRNVEMQRIEEAVDAVVADSKWAERLRLADWTPPKASTP